MSKTNIVDAGGVDFTSSNYSSTGDGGAVYPTDAELIRANRIPTGTNTEIYYRNGTMDVFTRNGEEVLTIVESGFKVIKDVDNNRYFDTDGDFIGTPEPPYGGGGR